VTSKAPWRPLTRRGFLAMLSAAVAVVAVKRGVAIERGPTPTVWIGHC
jgi:hypothetical protein